MPINTIRRIIFSEREVSSMKINGNLEGVFKAYKTAKVEKKESEELKSEGQTKSEGIKDKVTISADSRIESRKFEIDFMKRKIGDVAEVRADRVADIKQRIQDGTYNIDLDKVAEAILNRVI